MSEAEISHPAPCPVTPVSLVAVPSPVDRFKRLRDPFEPHQIGKLPRTTCRDCSKSQTKVCGQHKKKECRFCGNWMTAAHIDLDYVGHAAVTDRLLEVDPEWTWEPMSVDPQTGVPLLVNNGSTLWIKLTVLGVSRIGVGTVEDGKFEAEKQLIGDAIRNAAMRFGVALDLWSKEDLSRPEESTHEVRQNTSQPSEALEEPQESAAESVVEMASDETYASIGEGIQSLTEKGNSLLREWWKSNLPSFATKTNLSADDARAVLAQIEALPKRKTANARAVLAQTQPPPPTGHQLLDVIWVEREVTELSDQKNVAGLILNRVIKDIATDLSDDEARMVANTVDDMTDDDLKALILEAQ